MPYSQPPATKLPDAPTLCNAQVFVPAPLSTPVTPRVLGNVYAPAPNGILEANMKILPQVRDARKRGVLFDVGNGRTDHWTWEVAERAFQQDFLPDTLSTDMTAAGRTFPVARVTAPLAIPTRIIP